MTLKSILVRTLVAAFLMLLWGMFFWGVLYDDVSVYRDHPDETLQRVAAALTESNLESGAYFYPWPRDTKEAAESWLAAHRQGPFFELHFSRAGVDPQSPKKLVLGALQYAFVSLLGTMLALLSGTRGARTFVLILLAGVMGTIFIQITRPLWFHLPWHYSLAHASFEVVSWALLAASIAFPGRRG